MKKLAFAALLAALTISQANAANIVTINYNTVGCLDEENLDQSIRLGESGDHEAYTKFLTPLIASGECLMLPAKSKVYLEDFSLMSGTACVRPKGDPRCVTVEYEAVQEKEQESAKPAPAEEKDESLLFKLFK